MMRNLRNRWRSPRPIFSLTLLSLLPSVVVIGLLVLVRLSGMLQQLEWVAFDWMMRSRPAEPLDPHITIIGINEADIASLGRYPISDQELANLLNTLHRYEPAAIGVDIFRDLVVPANTNPTANLTEADGSQALAAVFRQHPNTIAIQTILPGAGGSIVPPPPYVPPEQIGFADMLPDADGSIRRSLLGSLDLQNQFQLSFAIQLANLYLTAQGQPLGNGVRDPQAMRFGATEIPRFHPNTGAYIRADAGGIQTLLNFRSGRDPFRRLSLAQINAGEFEPAWLEDRIILIGITAESAKDTVNSAAVDIDNPALFYGVIAQAHAVSQILNAAQTNRPLLQVWSDPWEYAWIVAWGILGWLLGRWLRSPLRILIGVVLASLIVAALCFASLLAGWWLPFVPALAALFLNGTGLAAAALYRQEQDLRSRLVERQAVIEQTFNSIHNGPLQTLATLLKQTAQSERVPPDVHTALHGLNQELRAVYESVRKEVLTEGDRLYLGTQQSLDLNTPIHELLYEVYCAVLERDFPGFQSLQVKIVKFDPLNEAQLTVEQRRGLCRFLEEALCNVGKHADRPTRLQVTCTQHNGMNRITVTDNGQTNGQMPSGQNTSGQNTNGQTPLAAAVGAAAQPHRSPTLAGMGTRQAQTLAAELGGHYERSPHPPQGTKCELQWCAHPAAAAQSSSPGSP